MATRFKITSSTTAPAVSPTYQSYTHLTASRRQLLTTDASALTTSAVTPDAADHGVAGDTVHRQWVSDPIAAGKTFTNGDVIKLCIQALEAHANNNLSIQLFVSVVDSAGTTVQRVLRSKVVKAGEIPTALTSQFLSTTQDGATYTTVANDRLVVEISVQGTPGGGGGVQGHNASLRTGGNGAGGDLLEDDTQTGTTLNPWIEFVPNLFGATEFQQTLAVASTFGVSMVRQLSFLRTLAVTSTFSPVLNRGVSYLRTLAVDSTFAVSMVTGLVFQKLLEVSSTMTASLTESLVFARTLAVGSVMTPALEKAITFRQALAATSSFIGALVTEFIAGEGGAGNLINLARRWLTTHKHQYGHRHTRGQR